MTEHKFTSVRQRRIYGGTFLSETNLLIKREFHNEINRKFNLQDPRNTMMRKLEYSSKEFYELRS